MVEQRSGKYLPANFCFDSPLNVIQLWLIKQTRNIVVTIATTVREGRRIWKKIYGIILTACKENTGNYNYIKLCMHPANEVRIMV